MFTNCPRANRRRIWIQCVVLIFLTAHSTITRTHAHAQLPPSGPHAGHPGRGVLHQRRHAHVHVQPPAGRRQPDRDRARAGPAGLPEVSESSNNNNNSNRNNPPSCWLLLLLIGWLVGGGGGGEARRRGAAGAAASKASGRAATRHTRTMPQNIQRLASRKPSREPWPWPSCPGSSLPKPMPATACGSKSA